MSAHNVKIEWALIAEYPTGWGIRKHSHPFFQFWFCDFGECDVCIGGKDLHMQTNDFVMIPPQNDHELFPTKVNARFIEIKFHVLDKDLEALLLAGPTLVHIKDSEFKNCLQVIHDEWVSDNKYSEEITQLLLEQALYIYLRDDIKKPPMPDFYRLYVQTSSGLTGIASQIADYVSVHYKEPMSLDNMADVFCYSKNYLCKVFKESSNFTITEYYNYVKICNAWDLVCGTDKKIDTISEECGFSSIHYFSRMFKKITGMTPTEARDSHIQSLNLDIKLHGTFLYRYNSKEKTDK